MHLELHTLPVGRSVKDSRGGPEERRTKNSFCLKSEAWKPKGAVRSRPLHLHFALSLLQRSILRPDSRHRPVLLYRRNNPPRRVLSRVHVPKVPTPTRYPISRSNSADTVCNQSDRRSSPTYGSSEQSIKIEKQPFSATHRMIGHGVRCAANTPSGPCPTVPDSQDENKDETGKPPGGGARR